MVGEGSTRKEIRQARDVFLSFKEGQTKTLPPSTHTVYSLKIARLGFFKEHTINFGWRQQVGLLYRVHCASRIIHHKHKMVLRSHPSLTPSRRPHLHLRCHHRFRHQSHLQSMAAVHSQSCSEGSTRICHRDSVSNKIAWYA